MKCCLEPNNGKYCRYCIKEQCRFFRNYKNCFQCEEYSFCCGEDALKKLNETGEILPNAKKALWKQKNDQKKESFKYEENKLRVAYEKVCKGNCAKCIINQLCYKKTLIQIGVENEFYNRKP